MSTLALYVVPSRQKRLGTYVIQVGCFEYSGFTLTQCRRSIDKTLITLTFTGNDGSSYTIVNTTEAVSQKKYNSLLSKESVQPSQIAVPKPLRMFADRKTRFVRV